MRALLKTIHVLLSLVVFIGAINLAFALAEGYWVGSGRFRPGEILEYFERPARQFSEVAMRALVSLAVICLAALAQWRLKRWSTSALHNTSLKPTAEDKPKSSEPPGSGGRLT